MMKGGMLQLWATTVAAAVAVCAGQLGQPLLAPVVQHGVLQRQLHAVVVVAVVD